MFVENCIENCKKKRFFKLNSELMQRAHAARQAAAQKNRAQSLPNAAYDRVNVGHSNNSYDRVNVRPAAPGYTTGYVCVCVSRHLSRLSVCVY